MAARQQTKVLFSRPFLPFLYFIRDSACALHLPIEFFASPICASTNTLMGCLRHKHITTNTRQSVQKKYNYRIDSKSSLTPKRCGRIVWTKKMSNSTKRKSLNHHESDFAKNKSRTTMCITSRGISASTSFDPYTEAAENGPDSKTVRL